MMNPEMYASQVFVHDRATLKAVGGGSYHSCGCWKQNIPTVMSAQEVGTLDFGINQSQMNDIDEVYQHASCYRKHLHQVTATVDDLRSGAILERFPTGVPLLCLVKSIDEAAQLMEDYRSHSARCL